MKKFYFMLVAMFVAMAANASKVYFDNTDTNWSTVNAYAWGGNVSDNKSWPGNAMTEGADGIWSIEFTGTPEQIIFNNGNGSQTGDLDFKDGATFDFYGVKGAELSTFKVYFDNSTANWSTVKAYYWGGGAENGWPGDDMTQGANNLWSIEIKASSAPKNIIFNNGGGSKTGDLTFVDGATYNENGKKREEGEEISYKVSIRGAFNTWSSDANSTAELVDNCATITVNNYSEGTGEGAGFKVVVNDGSDHWFSTGGTLVKGWNDNVGTESANMSLPLDASGKNITFTVAIDNYTTGSVNVKVDYESETTGGGDGPEPLVAEHVYIVGDATPAGWNIGSPTELTKTGNYTFVYEGPLSAGEFKAYTSTGNYDCARIRPNVKGVTIDGNGVSNNEFVYKAGNDYKWQVTEAGNYRIVFDLEHYTITATRLGEIAVNPYDYWYIGLAYGGNDWNAESFECRPDENGIAVFPEVESIGGYFRIRMWDNNERKAYKLCGPEVSAVDTWYEADREADNGDGAFHIVTPILTGAVVVTVDVLNNKVKLNYGAGIEPYTINVYYDNRVTKWDNVRIHAWNSVSNKSTDLDLTREDNTGGMWYVNATIGFQPDMLLFFNGSWGEGNQTADMTFENNKTYGEAPAVKLEEGGVVWFNNTDNWEDVYVHYWNEGKDNGWPGEKMTHYAHPQLANKVNGEDADFGDAHGLYFFDIPAGGVQGIVFNNGLEGDDLRQTENIEGDAIRDKGVYSPSGYTNSTTGIDIIEAAGEGKAEYFNLQGVRVAEPANGLYIVRRGGKVTKEIIR